MMTLFVSCENLWLKFLSDVLAYLFFTFIQLLCIFRLGSLRHLHWKQLLIVKVKMLVTQLCLTLYDPSGYSIHGILQTRIPEWVAMPFYRGFSWPRDWTQISCIAGRFFSIWATRKHLLFSFCWLFFLSYSLSAPLFCSCFPPSCFLGVLQWHALISFSSSTYILWVFSLWGGYITQFIVTTIF